jgi:acyl carrier protein
MNIQDIRDAIAEREKQIRFLQQEIKSLTVAAEILKGRPSTEKPQTQPDMAYAVLDHIGKSMHVSQIVTQIKKEFSVTIKPNNLGVMLFRYAKRGKRFYKVQGRKNTYGLIKWQELSERLESSKTSHVEGVAN